MKVITQKTSPVSGRVLLVCSRQRGLHLWLVGHSKDHKPLCARSYSENDCVKESERERELQRERVWRQNKWVWRKPSEGNIYGSECQDHKNKGKQLTGYVQTLFILHLYNKKKHLRRTGKRVESMAGNQEHSNEWDFTERGILLEANTAMADSLLKTIVLKRELWEGGAMSVGVNADTYST